MKSYLGKSWVVSSYVGIVGLALSLVGAISSLHVLAPWMEWIVSNWQAITHAIWSFIANLIGIALTNRETAMLNYLLFSVLLFGSVVVGGKPLTTWMPMKQQALWSALLFCLMFPVVYLLLKPSGEGEAGALLRQLSIGQSIIFTVLLIFGTRRRQDFLKETVMRLSVVLLLVATVLLLSEISKFGGRLGTKEVVASFTG